MKRIFRNIAYFLAAIALGIISFTSMLVCFFKNLMQLVMGLPSYWSLENEWFQIEQDFVALNTWRKK